MSKRRKHPVYITTVLTIKANFKVVSRKHSHSVYARLELETNTRAVVCITTALS